MGGAAERGSSSPPAASAHRARKATLLLPSAVWRRARARPTCVSVVFALLSLLLFFFFFFFRPARARAGRHPLHTASVRWHRSFSLGASPHPGSGAPASISHPSLTCLMVSPAAPRTGAAASASGTLCLVAIKPAQPFALDPSVVPPTSPHRRRLLPCAAPRPLTWYGGPCVSTDSSRAATDARLLPHCTRVSCCATVQRGGGGRNARLRRPRTKNSHVYGAPPLARHCRAACPPVMAPGTPPPPPHLHPPTPSPPRPHPPSPPQP